MHNAVYIPVYTFHGILPSQCILYSIQYTVYNIHVTEYITEYIILCITQNVPT